MWYAIPVINCDVPFDQEEFCILYASPLYFFKFLSLISGITVDRNITVATFGYWTHIPSCDVFHYC